MKEKPKNSIIQVQGVHGDNREIFFQSLNEELISMQENNIEIVDIKYSTNEGSRNWAYSALIIHKASTNEI